MDNNKVDGFVKLKSIDIPQNNKPGDSNKFYSASWNVTNSIGLI